jgi:hypothetical protein
MYHFGSCGEMKQEPNIVCKERKSKFIIRNKSKRKILKVQVDKCLEIQGKRCDWLLIDTSENNAYFIELKGCELDRAILQLRDSIIIISKPKNGFIKQEFSRKHAYAVLSRSPKDSGKIKDIQKTFMKKIKTELIVKNREVEIKL